MQLWALYLKQDEAINERMVSPNTPLLLQASIINDPKPYL